MYGLYVHIPFCVRKCLYCDFYSEAEKGSPVAPRPPRRDFLDALETELRALPEGFVPDTLFIGGGTPTELSPEDFAHLLDMLARQVDLSRVEEWSCEANPGTLTDEHIRLMREAGINRVSLGVQSFDARVLQFLGRIHDPDEAMDAYARLREHGMTNLNLDLIYAVPGFGLDTTNRDLDQLLRLQPEHIACYGLMFEEGTPLDGLRLKGRVHPVDEALEEQQYVRVRERLCEAGYARYEISNYARPGLACRHNLLYWSGGEYLGCGPSAHSHWQGARWANVRDLAAYQAALAGGRLPRTGWEELAPRDRARETLVMSLRRAEGIDETAFAKQTGFALTDLAGPALADLLQQGLLEREQGCVRLSDKALFISDAVLAELL